MPDPGILRHSAALLAAIAASSLIAEVAHSISLSPGDIVALGWGGGTEMVARIDPVTGAQTLFSTEGGRGDVVISEQGRIFISHREDVYEIDAETGARTLIAAASTSTWVDELAVTPAGDIIVLVDGAMTLIDPDTGTVTPLPIPSGFYSGIDVDANGDLHTVLWSGPSAQKYSLAGALLQSYPITGLLPVNGLSDVALAPNGELVAVDVENDVFARIDTTTGAVDLLGPLSFYGTRDLLVEASGDYLMPLSANGVWGVQRVDATTGTITPVSSLGFISNIRSIGIVPAAVPIPPPEETFEPCPDAGSPLADPIVLCALATGQAGPAFDTESGFAAGPVPVSLSETDSGAEVDGAAQIDSTLGAATISASVEKTGTTSAGDAEVIANVHWHDTVTIDAAGYTGDAGHFRSAFSITFDPINAVDLVSGGNVLAESSYRVEMRTDDFAPWQKIGTIGRSDSTAEGAQSYETGQPTPHGVLTGYSDMVFGTPFDLDIELQVRVRVDGDDAASTAIADASAELVWLGILDVRRNSLGDPVPPELVTVTSTSGTDWLPEPASGLLTMSGTLALVAAGRRRTTRR